MRAIRLDSGDLAELAKQTRALLDSAELKGVQIFASSGLDEYEISRLLARGAPIDGFGVGSKPANSHCENGSVCPRRCCPLDQAPSPYAVLISDRLTEDLELLRQELLR